MALVLKDRVKEVTSVTSTGTATLLGTVVGFQTFNTAIPTGSTVYYCIAGQSISEWEVGVGTFTAPDQLSRDTVYSSSAAGAPVNFSAGTKDVFVTYPSERAVFEETDGTTVLRQGPITVVGANASSYTSFGASLGEFYANTPSFAQLYVQNLNGASNASSDIVAYNNLGDGSTKFIDMGICSSAYTEAAFPIFTPNSGYLYNDGGVLLVGSATNNVTIFSGGVNTNNAVVTFGTNKSASFTGNVSVVGNVTSNANATVGGTIVIEGGAFSNAANITALNQLTTKAYVDNATAAGLHIHEPVNVASTTNLVAVYNNGANGVGATLTNNATQATVIIDNVTLSANNRVLVWQQSNAVQNGVYVVTNTGSNATNWVLTRSSDTNTSSQNDPNSLGGGDYFYVIGGDTQAGDSFVCTSEGNITFGTTLITFSLFSAAPTYTGTAPINVSGQTIALTGTVAAINGGTGANTVATGDLLYGSATNTWSKLPVGAGYKSLIVNAAGTQVEWNAVALNQTAAVSGTLAPTNGGTGISSYTQGEMLYANTSTQLDKVTPNTTTTKKFLSQTGTGTAGLAPSWAQPAASDITGLAPSATTDTANASNITSGTLPSGRLTGSYTGITGVGTLTAGAWTANAIAVAYGGTGATNTTGARTNLGLTIGTDVQAYNLQLASVAALATNGLLNRSAANTVSIASAADIVAQIGSTAVTNATTAATANALNTGNNYTVNTFTVSSTAPRLFFADTNGTTFSLYNETNVFYLLNSGGSTLLQCDTSGNFTAVGNVTAYSDERLKKNWRPVQDNFIEKLAQVKSGIYDRTDIEATQAGASAQDMQKLLPEVVQDGEHLALAYGNAALVAAIELAKQVVELKKEIELLKAK